MKTVDPQEQLRKTEEARKELARLYRIFGRVVFLVLPRGQKGSQIQKLGENHF